MKNRRFLRARKFDVNGGLAQFKATEEWRKTNHIDALYENIDVESYEDSRRVVRLMLCLICFLFSLTIAVSAMDWSS